MIYEGSVPPAEQIVGRPSSPADRSPRHSPVVETLATGGLLVVTVDSRVT
jgi:hypothetical protein